MDASKKVRILVQDPNTKILTLEQTLELCKKDR